MENINVFGEVYFTTHTGVILFEDISMTYNVEI